jgi:CysZ protein
MTALMPSWLPEWLASALMWILWPLFFLLLTLIVFFSFSVIANILAAPFNGPLAEAVEIRLSGQAPPAISWGQIIKDTPRMLFNEFRKLAYMLMWVIPLLLLSFIPVVNLASPLFWAVFSGWMLALDYHDFPMGNHQLMFTQQRSALRKRRALVLGFGLATLAATMVPVLNFLVIPAAVAGATALYVENLKQ